MLPNLSGMRVAEIESWLRQQPLESLDAILPLLDRDGRKGVRNLAERFRLRVESHLSQVESYEKKSVFEKALWAKGYELVAGVDEAGRGPLAGPVVAAAVILDPNVRILGLDDSKRLSPSRREDLSRRIKAEALAWRVAVVSHSEIDRINVAQAAFIAMRQALDGLKPVPQYALVDGFPIPGAPCPQRAVVAGDALINSVAAASILAKVHRARIMMGYARRYPQYGFDVHKGYCTREHREAIERFGLSPIHRRTFCKGIVGNVAVPPDRLLLSKEAEGLAALHLRQEGFRIVARNYRCRLGEIDIIARDGEAVVFVEVKARRSFRFGAPAESVTERKRRSLEGAARYYLMQNPSLADKPCRFDVVTVDYAEAGHPVIDLIRNAFLA